MNKKLKKFLDSDLLYKLNKKYWCLNRGGCGEVARIMAEQLLKYPDPKIKNVAIAAVTNQDVICLESLKYTHSHKLNFKKSSSIEACITKKFGVSVHILQHIVCCFTYDDTLYVFDADTGLLDKANYTYITDYEFHTGFFTLDEIKQLNSNPKNWNCSFDRDQVPSIEKTVAKMFTKHLKTQKLVTA